MPIPSDINDLDPVAANNFPGGSEAVGTNMDDYLRAGFAITRQVYDDLGSAAEEDIGTSGATVPLLNGANIWSANQRVSLADPTVWNGDSNTNTGALLRATNTDNTAGSIAGLQLSNRSSSAGTGGIFLVCVGANDSDLYILDEGGDIIFGGASTATEYARITSGGKLLVGTSTAPGSAKGAVVGANGAPTWPAFSGGADIYAFGNNANGTVQLTTPNTAQGAYFFSDEDSRTSGGILYNHSTDTLNLWAASASRFSLTSAGGAFTGTLSGSNVTGGTYTPTLTNTTNIAASSVSGTFTWSRNQNMVNVSGMVSIDPTSASANTELRISLPVSSSFSDTGQCGGHGAIFTSSAEVASGGIAALSGGSVVRLSLQSPGTAARDYSINFSYRVV